MCDSVGGSVKFSEIVKQAIALLQDSGRLTYRTLKREFALDDEALEDLKFELIKGQKLAIDEEGEVLVWTGDGQATTPIQPAPSLPQSQPPSTYTCLLYTSPSPRDS